MIIVLFSYNLIIYMQEDFSTKYDLQTVEALDFTLVISKLPDNFSVFENEMDLNFALWNEITEAIEYAKDIKLVPKTIDPTIIAINIALKDLTI